MAGVQFVVNYVNKVPVIKLHARVTRIDPETRKLDSDQHSWRFNPDAAFCLNENHGDIPLNSKSKIISQPLGDYVSFKHSNMATDFGQTALPFFDIQEVIPNPLSPLRGVGFYFKTVPGSGGFVGLGVVPNDYNECANDMNIDTIKSMVEASEQKWMSLVSTNIYKPPILNDVLPVNDLRVETIALVNQLWEEIDQHDLTDTIVQDELIHKVFTNFYSFIFRYNSYLTFDWPSDKFLISTKYLEAWKVLDSNFLMVSMKFNEFRSICKLPIPMKPMTAQQRTNILTFIESIFAKEAILKNVIDLNIEHFQYILFELVSIEIY